MRKGTPVSKLPIKVVPGSSRDGVAGWLGEMLKIRVRAPAERGKANAAAAKIVAEALDIPKERARIVAGWTSPRKVVELSGVSDADLRQRLEKITG